ncbi:MAG: transketolase [Sporomusaceae bacterium]|jgi:transketolase|nr:transketolase [Sporomusaceae bacterium]
MALTKKREEFLKEKCRSSRQTIIELLHKIKTGHPGGSLSCVEILTVLYYEKMHIDPQDAKNPRRDMFVLSKGHAAPALYIVLADLGFFPKDELPTLRQLNSNLQGHPCALKTNGVELSTGPLGLGVSAAVGMACAAKLDGADEYTYVLAGDGELQEGIVWEALMSASKYKLDNLIIIVDCNGVQLDGTVAEIMPLGSLKDKLSAFGCHVLEVDGHDVRALDDILTKAKKVKGAPVCVLAQTVKGKGVSFMEGKNTWHGKAIGQEDYEKAVLELGAK